MNLQEILSGAEAAVAAAGDERALDEVRVKYLGKKGELTALLKTLGSLEAEERPKAGAAINEAIRCREEGKEECIVFNFSGHGLCDLAAYDRYLAGDLEDYAYPQDKIEEAIAKLPEV